MSGEVEIGFDDMKEIIDDFLVEADELIDSLDSNLVSLESAPDDLDLLNEIFRAAHTIKGTSSFLGFEQVTSLTHKMEDILNRLRKSELAVTPEIMDLLLESLDLLKVLLENVRNGITEEIDLTDIIARLKKANDDDAGETAQTPPAEVTATDEPITEVPDQPELPEDVIEVPDQPAPEHPAAESVPEAKSTGRRQVADKKPSGDQTIRVDVSRLDSLMNLMGELVLGRNSLVQTVNRMSSEPQAEQMDKVNQATASINYITTELQLAVMKMRMQPVGKVFSRYPRLVRDLSRDSGKKINLIIKGEETELDKSVIEEIGDPLVHIIRNSCDHGIESPADRVARGKPETGTVRLSASQEGSNIVIKIQDDGKGLDVNAIRDKAVERGLVSRTEVDRLPDKEVFRYIFEPGFRPPKSFRMFPGVASVWMLFARILRSSMAWWKWSRRPTLAPLFPSNCR